MLAGGVGGVGEDVHLGVVVPRVAAGLARGAELELLFLILQRLGIEMRRAEHDLAAAGPEERARRLARSAPFLGRLLRKLTCDHRQTALSNFFADSEIPFANFGLECGVEFIITG